MLQEEGEGRAHCRKRGREGWALQEEGKEGWTLQEEEEGRGGHTAGGGGGEGTLQGEGRAHCSLLRNSP